MVGQRNAFERCARPCRMALSTETRQHQKGKQDEDRNPGKRRREWVAVEKRGRAALLEPVDAFPLALAVSAASCLAIKPDAGMASLSPFLWQCSNGHANGRASDLVRRKRTPRRGRHGHPTVLYDLPHDVATAGRRSLPRRTGRHVRINVAVQLLLLVPILLGMPTQVMGDGGRVATAAALIRQDARQRGGQLGG